MPDVCQNSWGVTPSGGLPEPCDSTLVGRHRQLRGRRRGGDLFGRQQRARTRSLRSPATGPPPRRTASPWARPPTTRPTPSARSPSRGPSQCGGDFAIKPEVMAPGENIISSFPGGSYVLHGRHLDGRAPRGRRGRPDAPGRARPGRDHHQGNPDGDRHRRALGEDNAYGHGMVDAYAAVAAVLDNAGHRAGIVTDADTGLPSKAWSSSDTRGFAQTTTDADGNYGFTILGGATTLTSSYFGYQPINWPSPCPAAAPRPGHRPDAHDPGRRVGHRARPRRHSRWPAPPSRPWAPPSRRWSVTGGLLRPDPPFGPEAAYDLLALAPDLAYSLVTPGLQGDRTIDFDLPVLQSDGFESGGFATFDWQLTGDALWTVAGDQAYEGVISATQRRHHDGQSTTLTRRLLRPGRRRILLLVQESTPRSLRHPEVLRRRRPSKRGAGRSTGPSTRRSFPRASTTCAGRTPRTIDLQWARTRLDRSGQFPRHRHPAECGHHPQ